MNGRTGRAGYDADRTRILGNLLLMCRVKQAFLTQLLFQLLKGRMQVTYAIHSHCSAVQLIRTIAGENRDFS